jgi:polysaccharide export outer membrane protein
MLDLCAPLYARQLCPPNEIWMSDSDIVIVPKGRILQVDEFINLVFTRGIYGVLPMQGVAINFAKASTL